jgi:anti-sigma B factor antagonist
MPSLGRAVVTVRGELDVFTAPRLHETIAQGIELGARYLVVDLGVVTFIDSTALGVLIGAAKRLAVVAGSLAVVCQNQNVRRVLELTGLDSVFAIHATLAEALSATPSG